MTTAKQAAFIAFEKAQIDHRLAMQFPSLIGRWKIEELKKAEDDAFWAMMKASQ